MKGDRLSELLTKIYAESPVSHILSGKAVSRDLRAHFFINAALMSKLFDAELSSDFSTIGLICLADVAEAYEGEIAFSMEEEFTSVENEAGLLDIEGTLEFLK